MGVGNNKTLVASSVKEKLKQINLFRIFEGVGNDTEATKLGDDLIAFIIIWTSFYSKIHYWEF